MIWHCFPLRRAVRHAPVVKRVVGTRPVRRTRRAVVWVCAAVAGAGAGAAIVPPLLSLPRSSGQVVETGGLAPTHFYPPEYYQDIAVQPVAVPEPGSLELLAAGLAAMLAWGRR